MTTLQIYQHADIQGKSKALEQYEQQLVDVRACSRQIESSSNVSTLKNIDNNCGTPSWVRTSDLRLRSPLLYPAELSGHTSVNYTALRYNRRR